MASKVITTIFCTILLSCNIYAQTQSQPAPHAATQIAPRPAVIYGSNIAVGSTFTHDGVKLYYEVYGLGEPLLLVHGNGGSIATFKAQIDHFRKSYKVIAMDSRDQGRSADSPEQDHLREDDGRPCSAARPSENRACECAGLERWRNRGAAARHPASGEGEEDRSDGREPESDC